MSSPPIQTLTATHWGTYQVQVENHRVTAIQPFSRDRDPSPIGQSLLDTVDDPLRIRQPMVREGYLRHGPRRPTTNRGAEPFVAVDWNTALDLVAREIDRVRQQYGNQAIYAGSYGWASAGRFHHAQSQLRRLLNLLGGFTHAVNTYSDAAAEVIVSHVLGSLKELHDQASGWDVLAEHCQLMVMFGGMPLRNAQVDPGGVGSHDTRYWLERCRARGTRFVNLSPMASDAADFLDAQWLPLRPNSDTAVMLGLAHTLVSENLHDRDFLHRYCVGFQRFLPYLLGETDGQVKDAEWAAGLSELPAESIRGLAREMAAKRTLISLSLSVQRVEHGEQPYWMAITLAAMLGQMGLPGGGFSTGMSALHGIGNPASQVAWAALDQGRNPVKHFIPVARISDLLLNPGGELDYNGQRLTLPDIRLVYWVGGNPFHHHQDINRLLRAWQQPETVVVHERWWNALARHADIVLPATIALERNDMALNRRDGFAVAMRQAIPAVGEARDDHAICAGLAERFGLRERFTEGRGEMDWLAYLYNISRQRAASEGIELPTFEAFWQAGYLELPAPRAPRVHLAGFRADPQAHPRPTPSGKIEIYSETIDGFGYPDCPGHPVWQAPDEWLGGERAARYPLHLISCQPATRLHSQLDNGVTSRNAKVAGREPISLNPGDAAQRGIRQGDVVRVYNDRGACLAGAVLSEAVRPGVVQLATGAWYDPLEPGQIGTLDKHGNPNLLTRDRGTSRLAQGPTAHSALVEVARVDGEAPPVTVHEPPTYSPRSPS